MHLMSETNLRIASYNIRKARGLDNKRMPERIVEVINGLEADIVLLQEADTRLGVRKPAIPRALIETETDFDLLEVSESGVSLGWHGNAVLIRPDLAVSDVERLDLPGFEPRGAIRFTLVDSTLSIVATHLGLMRRDRRAQLTALRGGTATCANAIIAGDLNEWSKSKGFEALDGRFSLHAPGLSFHARRPIAALDRFAVTDGVAMVGGGVDDAQLARKASDHLPVWADVVVAPPARNMHGDDVTTARSA